jgi:hypothetical protein
MGLMLEPHVVQVNGRGAFTLTHQRVFSLKPQITLQRISVPLEFELIKILDEVDDDFIFKRVQYRDKKENQNR